MPAHLSADVRVAASRYVYTVGHAIRQPARGNTLDLTVYYIYKKRMTYAVKAEGLRKAFGGITVLDGVDLKVAEGSIVALLGPNGAGKPEIGN
jgi:ABC-type polysaccharide/polyol phosphate transport system ATPase subunit